MKKNLYKISAFICTMCMLLTACSKKIESKVYTYTELDNGTIQITGLTDYGNELSELVIPAKLDDMEVSSVAAGAFKDASNIRSVSVEDGVLSIEDNAFINCYNLEKVELPQSVVNIGANAFRETRLEKERLEQDGALIINGILLEVRDTGSEYSIPEGVKVVGCGVFYGNTEIKKLKLGNEVERLEAYACADMSALEEVVWGDNIQKLGYGAFSGCTKLELNVPDKISEVEKEAFRNVSRIVYGGGLDSSEWGMLQLDKQ